MKETAWYQAFWGLGDISDEYADELVKQGYAGVECNLNDVACPDVLYKTLSDHGLAMSIISYGKEDNKMFVLWNE